MVSIVTNESLNMQKSEQEKFKFKGLLLIHIRLFFIATVKSSPNVTWMQVMKDPQCFIHFHLHWTATVTINPVMNEWACVWLDQKWASSFLVDFYNWFQFKHFHSEQTKV